MSIQHLSLTQEETGSSSLTDETDTDSHANSDDNSMATQPHHDQCESDGFLSSTPTNQRISNAQSTQTQSLQYTIAEESDHEDDMDVMGDTPFDIEHLQAPPNMETKSISKSITRRKTNSIKYTRSVSDHDEYDVNGDEVYDIYGEPPFTKEEQEAKEDRKKKQHKRGLIAGFCCFLLVVISAFVIYFSLNPNCNKSSEISTPSKDPEFEINPEITAIPSYVQQSQSNFVSVQ